MNRLALLALSLCACASVPMARRDLADRAKDPSAPADAAHVYVYRPSGVMGSAVYTEVLLDEGWVATLGPGTFTRLTVRPGEHKVLARANGGTDRTFVAEAGRSYYLRTKPAWRWSRSGPGADLELVADEREARDEVRSCGLVANGATVVIRRLAKEVSAVHVDFVDEEALVAVAARALKAIDGPLPPGTPAPDLDATVAQLRATHPELGEDDVVRIGMDALLESARAPMKLVKLPPVDGACGLVVRQEAGKAVLAAVVPESPAAAARLEPGEEVREVAGVPARERTPDEIVKLLAGAPGTEVAVVTGKPGAPDRKTVLRRAAPVAGPVECRLLAGRVLYLNPWGAWPATVRRVRDHGRSPAAAAGLVVLDLRDPRGGNVDGVWQLADTFLAGGKVFSLTGARRPEANLSYEAGAKTSPLEEARLVVLVGEGTRGTAEAVAAALQDARRATVVGGKTAGVGTLEQPIHPLGTTLRVPFARMLRASGEPIEGRGVTPDVPVDPKAAAAGEPVEDVACPGIASPGPVAADPAVRRAVGLLLAPGS